MAIHTAGAGQELLVPSGDQGSTGGKKVQSEHCGKALPSEGG